MKPLGEILTDMGLVPATPDEAELYAHRTMRRFGLLEKLTTVLPDAALAKVSPKAAREAVAALCSSLAEELVTQAFRVGRAAAHAKTAEAARELGYLVADRAGNICTLEGKVLFTGDPADAVRIVAVVNGVLDATRGE